MREALADGIPLVGVFVNPTLQEVLAWVQAGLIDWVQLHGQESESLIRQVQRESGLPVIKAFTVHTAEELHQAADSPAEHLLLDSGTGTGKAFDWRLLAGFQRPYLLAGGLHPENVGEAIQQLSPWGVDTSSGIETEGWQDPEKMRRFVAAARSGAK